MRIGYACLAVGVPGTALHTCHQSKADDAVLKAVIEKNLTALRQLILYNIEQGIGLFRISSDIIPFGSSPVNQLPWQVLYAEQLSGIGELIRRSRMRVSMHPGQYTVINALDDGVVRRAIADLGYHADFIDALGVDSGDKIILHIGGVYGDKPAALARFASQYEQLDPSIKNRLVIENDERLFTVEDALSLNRRIGVPVVFDNLHHALNRYDAASSEPAADCDWIKACRSTWRPEDGPQKIHYSQQEQDKRPGAHSSTITAQVFVADMAGLSDDLDVMLEVKDKNLSAVKCSNCLRTTGPMTDLEKEWARYKYEVLEHAPVIYQAIRELLKDKKAWPVLPFYRYIEMALLEPVTLGHAMNAAQHVWGYLKQTATPQETKTFEQYLARYRAGGLSLASLKRLLCRIAMAQDQPYLRQSLYLTRQCAMIENR
ncbi:MAG: UV DNA damage repair endonuclease UvsE [Bacillota bacterium]|nr:UV DNA damage repair endonuclease UvsE [Bacillota bacterium]